MKKIRILLTGAGAPGAGSIVHCLKDNGECKVDIIGIDKRKNVNTAHLFEKVYAVPAADSDDFIDAVKEICEKESIDVIVPIVTKELLKFSVAKKEFEEIGTRINVIDYEALLIANDKLRLFDYLNKKGLETPSYFEVTSTTDIVEKARKLGYPKENVCLKQACGNGSRGVRILSQSRNRYDDFFNEKPNSMICTLEEVVNILSERDAIPPMMVMDYLPGNEWGVDLLAKDGIVSNIMCRETTVIQHSITLECITKENKLIENYCKKIAKLLNITGNIGFDFKYDKTGKPQIIEINPRLTATVAINKASGINFPWLGVKQCLGYEVESVSNVNYVKMKRRYTEEYFYL